MRKNGHVTLGDQQSYYLQVFQRLSLTSFSNHKKETDKAIVFSCRTFSNIKGRNNAWSSDMVKRIFHLIGHKFSQFQALPSHIVIKKSKTI